MTMNGNTFVFHFPTRDVAEYRALAREAVRLKPYGRVEMNVSTLATKSFHDVPDNGSPWHEYASYNPTPFKFFPHEKIAPFLPSGFVDRNRELLLAKAEALREFDLGAAFWSYELNFLPEGFFEAYPQLRGPRIDHPRRSLQEAFAPCVDLPETREMISWMVQALTHHVPMLRTYFFKTNDAGAGLCWAHWQYAGENGPNHCYGRNMGDRVADLIGAIRTGAAAEGVNLNVHLTGNFAGPEQDAIRDHLPEGCFLQRDKHASMGIGGMVDPCYPARGIADPLGLLKDLQVLHDGHDRTIFIGLRSAYDRGRETLGVARLLLDVLESFLAEPVFGHIGILQRLSALCEKWVGPEHGPALFDALVALHDAFRFKADALPNLSGIYGGVSLRYITRPLVAVPQRLTPEEEAHWLPHVFNVSVAEARRDYIDLHGARIQPSAMPDANIWPFINAVIRLSDEVQQVRRTLADMDAGSHGETFRQMALALGIYRSVMKSCANFYVGQHVRDRNLEALDGQPRRPDKASDWGGSLDLHLMNETMRNELDNTQELIGLLRDCRMELICHADRPEEEDTFLLAADLVAQLKRKHEIMRRHWLDAQDYLTTPNR